MSAETRNAKITATSLGVEDHGLLTALVHLAWEGGGVGFGGYALDGPVHEDGVFVGRRGTDFGMEWIRRVLETLEVESWEKLPGTIVRIRSEGWGGKCLAIGHALKERWFEPSTQMDGTRGRVWGTP